MFEKLSFPKSGRSTTPWKKQASSLRETKNQRHGKIRQMIRTGQFSGVGAPMIWMTLNIWSMSFSPVRPTNLWLQRPCTHRQTHGDPNTYLGRGVAGSAALRARQQPTKCHSRSRTSSHQRAARALGTIWQSAFANDFHQLPFSEENWRCICQSHITESPLGGSLSLRSRAALSPGQNRPSAGRRRLR